MTTARFGFPRRFRIVKRSDLQQTLKSGLRSADGQLTVWATPNGLSYTRLGLLVGRKHGSAVKRNRIKRILREAFRLSRPTLPAGLDLVCAPRPGHSIRLPECRASLEKMAHRLAARLLTPGDRLT